MQLYYTPLSHFSRKVRIVLAGLGLETELLDAGNTAASDPALFGGNPLMSVPVLRDGNTLIFDSDVICEYLVRKHDPQDRYGVLRRDIPARNAHTVMNGIMSAEVDLILAARTGMDTGGPGRFEKRRRVIASGLGWLQEHAGLFGNAPDYLSFHLVCLWDHLVLFGNMPERPLPQLQQRAEQIQSLPMVAESRPDWRRK